MNTLLNKLYSYQAWANNDLFEKLGALDREKHQAELHAILRLINHSCVVARIFVAHLSGTQHEYTADNTTEIPSLDELRALVASTDQWYLDYLRNASSTSLSETIPFVFTDGDKGYMSRDEMLTHVVVHSGYHRGEVGRILWQISITPPWDTFAVYLHQTEPARRLQGIAPQVNSA
ncbi:putative damage-inducible protein DinB [Paraburkholderia youngii]|uniref:DinB family protein n=1 Tax=Paraburkholderia youngii TaxID=2782701 RepID=UPI000F5A8950|nr:damage-inducible protein DinB [Burkholderia cenocepacia]